MVPRRQTDLTNGCLLCTWHHHLLHKGEWAVVIAADGVPEIIPPTRIDPHQQPLRNQRFRRRREPG
ncbi:MAG: HNH endonuclease [Nocardioidaceae bacterium]